MHSPPFARSGHRKKRHYFSHMILGDVGHFRGSGHLLDHAFGFMDLDNLGAAGR
jgi:hypothetical protein